MKRIKLRVGRDHNAHKDPIGMPEAWLILISVFIPWLVVCALFFFTLLKII